MPFLQYDGIPSYVIECLAIDSHGPMSVSNFVSIAQE